MNSESTLSIICSFFLPLFKIMQLSFGTIFLAKCSGLDHMQNSTFTSNIWLYVQNLRPTRHLMWRHYVNIYYTTDCFRFIRFICIILIQHFFPHFFFYNIIQLHRILFCFKMNISTISYSWRKNCFRSLKMIQNLLFYCLTSCCYCLVLELLRWK